MAADQKYYKYNECQLFSIISLFQHHILRRGGMKPGGTGKSRKGVRLEAKGSRFKIKKVGM